MSAGSSQRAQELSKDGADVDRLGRGLAADPDWRCLLRIVPPLSTLLGGPSSPVPPQRAEHHPPLPDRGGGWAWPVRGARPGHGGAAGLGGGAQQGARRVEAGSQTQGNVLGSRRERGRGRVWFGCGCGWGYVGVVTDAGGWGGGGPNRSKTRGQTASTIDELVNGFDSDSDSASRERFPHQANEYAGGSFPSQRLVGSGTTRSTRPCRSSRSSRSSWSPL